MFCRLKNRYMAMVVIFLFSGFSAATKEPQIPQEKGKDLSLILAMRESHIELNKIEKKADEAIIYLLGDFYSLGVLVEKGSLGMKKAFREYRDVHCEFKALLAAGKNEKEIESEKLLCIIDSNEAQTQKMSSEIASFWGDEK